MDRAVLKSGYELHNGASRYVIESVLGKGGFGITYKAYSTSADDFKSYYAIKEFFVEDWCERNEHTGHIASTNPTRDKFENGKRDFFSEAKRLSQVSHSNIVKVYDVFEENNTVYYVMEYLEGESLDAYLKANGALAETQALALMKPIFDAVEVLHANNMTHLDIKPANIMLKKTEGGDSVAVLIDFGLAKHYDTEGNPTTTLRQSGYSDGYSPIEQYSGISTFSPQSDVYALAATLFHCLTGHRPTKSTELTEQELEEQLSANVSGNVKEAIVKAMRMGKNARTQSVAMFIDDLYKAECTQPVSIVDEEPYESEESQPIYDYDDEYEDEEPSSKGKILKIIYIVVVLGFIGWFCYEYMQDGSASNAEAMRQDSIANAESLAKARQDSIAKAYQDSIVKAREDSVVKARQDSIARRTRVTPDLALFELHGPVKSVTFKNRYLFHNNDEFTLQLSYTEDGKLKSINYNGYDYNKNCQFNRDGNGRIKKIITSFNEKDDFYITYDKNNRPIKIFNEGLEWDGTITYKYNASGFIVSENSYSGGEGCYGRTLNQYSNFNVDKYGNWTSRTSSTAYKEWYDGGEEPMSYSNGGTGTEYRTITYYE